MEIQKSTGIVLTSRVIGEADVLTSIFTEDYGIRKFIFKGLKKSRKRQKGAVEPGNLLNLVYYYRDNRDLLYANEFTIENHCLDLRNDLDKIFHLFFLLEITDKTTGHGQPSRQEYVLLKAGINALVTTRYPMNLAAFYTIHMLRLHGLLSDFNRCKSCGDSSFTGFCLDINDLNPVCSDCCTEYTRLHSSNIRKFIKASASQKFSSLDHSSFNKSRIADMLFDMTLFIENYYTVELKSKDFILN